MRPATRNARTLRSRCAHLGLVVAWLLATGMHLDALQLYAWTSMGFRFAQSEGTALAVVSTFKPENACPMCHAVQAARQQERNDTAAPTDQARPDIVFLALPEVVLKPPPQPSWLVSFGFAHGIDRPRPPLPPPRATALS